MIRAFLILNVVLLLAACANPFVQYYHPNPYYDASRRGDTAPAEPQVYAGRNPQQDEKALSEKGYTIIGYSSFNGASNKYGTSQAIDEGQRVGADLVLVYSQYTNTVSGYMPLITPHTETSNTNMNGNITGTGGTANIYSTATTTTYGSQTTYIPYSVNRSNYLAIYFAKIKEILGVFYNNLNDQQRQAVESNSGVVVTLVVDGTPAFNANILTGDIILKINDQSTTDINVFTKQIQDFAGQQITLSILRKGKMIQKKLILND